MTYTVSEANALLELVATKEQLRELILQVDDFAGGHVTLLYSGLLGRYSSDADDVLHSGAIAEALYEGGNDVRVINQTEVASFLQSDPDSSGFNEPFARAMERIFPDDLEGRRGFLYGEVHDGARVNNGIWDDLSARFAANASGDVVTFTAGASMNRVFFQTELPIILSNPKVTSIDGIPIAAFKGMSNAEAFRMIAAASEVRAAKLQIAVDDAGLPKVVDEHLVLDARSFFEDSLVIDGKAPAVDAPMRSLAEFLPPERIASHRQAIHDLRTAQSNLAHESTEALASNPLPERLRVLQALDHLGSVADIISLAAVAHEAKAAWDAGDQESAQQILSRWALENAGAILAGRLAALAVAPLLAAGPLGLLLAGGLTLSASIVGAAYADEVAEFMAGTLADLWEQGLEHLRDQFLRAEEMSASPLILDLDQNGVITLAESAAGVHFDHDGNGFAERTGWVSPSDGLLVRDLDGNGQIDRGGELFGNHTYLPNGQKARNGFEALEALDDNQDGVVDPHDAAWLDLKIWKDGNSNALVDEAELLSLAQAEVSRLGVAYTESNHVDDQGNHHKQMGSYDATDGSYLAMNDVWFRADRARTVDLNGTPISSDIAALPNLPGMGNVPSLHQAMESDETGQLRLIVESWIQAGSKQRSALIDPLIFHWSGTVQQVDGPQLSPLQRRVTAIEELLGQRYREGLQGPGHIGDDMLQLEQAFVDFRINVENQLLLQTDALPIISESLRHTDASTRSPGDMNVSEAMLYLDRKTASEDDPGNVYLLGRALRALGEHGSMIIASLQEHGADCSWKMELYLRLLSMHHWVEGTQADDALHGGSADDPLAAGVANAQLHECNGNDGLHAGVGDHNGFSDHCFHVLNGGPGNDHLKGGDGDDWLLTGSGNDTLDGGLGSDTYVIETGGGQRLIHTYDPSGEDHDVVIFDDVAAQDVTAVERHSHDLLLSHGQTDQLRLPNYFANQIFRVDEFRFAGGETWGDQELRDRVVIGGATTGDDSLGGYNDVANRIDGLDGHDRLTGGVLEDALQGGEGNDVLTGNDGNDLLNGGPGNDHLKGGDGDDRLLTGSGNDTLDGGLGSDTYVIEAGGGQRLIHTYDPSGEDHDLVIFDDVAAQDVTAVERHGHDLLLSHGQTDQLRLPNYFANQIFRVDEFRFAGGEIWGDQELRDRVVIGGATTGDDSLGGYNDVANRIDGLDGHDRLTGGVLEDALQGGEGNDVLTGNDGNDLLNGGPGNDHLKGGDGDDRLLTGSGNDTLEGGLGSDTYVIEAGGDQSLIVNYDPSGQDHDVVLFQALESKQVSAVELHGHNLVMRYGSADELTVQNYFANEVFRVEQFTFSNAVAWDDGKIRKRVVIRGETDGNDILGAYTDMANRINGMDGDDRLSGGPLNDRLTGGNGHDTLLGGAGHDVLKGGDGNDHLYGDFGRDKLIAGAGNNMLNGGAGDDKYVISKGGWHNLIVDHDVNTGNRDLVVLKGVHEQDVEAVEQQGGDLVMRFGHNDTLTVANYFADESFRIEQFKFRDAVLWGANELMDVMALSSLS